MKEGNTRDLCNPDKKMNIFVYGETGSGKTQFLGSFPKPYFIITERLPASLGIQGKKIDYVYIENFAEIGQVISEIAGGTRAKGCESVCFDSLSDVTPLVKKHVLQQNNKQMMNLQMWGYVVDNIRNMIHTFTRALAGKFHIGMSSRAVVIKDELTGSIKGIPDSVGKLAPVIPAYFDQSFVSSQQLKWENGERFPIWELNTVIKEQYPAKQLGFLDPVEPNDFAVIYQKYKDAVQKNLKES